MPSRSPAQHRLMEAVARDPKFARKVGIKPSVGKDFVAADEGRRFKGKKRKSRPERHPRSHDEFMQMGED